MIIPEQYRIKATDIDIPDAFEYDRMYRPGSTDYLPSDLIIYPWQVVMYKGKITYIVPTGNLINSHALVDDKYRAKLYTHDVYISDIFIAIDDFCELMKYNNYTGDIRIIMESKDMLSRVNEEGKDKKFEPLCLWEGHKFSDYVKSTKTQIKLAMYHHTCKFKQPYCYNDILNLLKLYIVDCVDNHNKHNDSCMYNFLFNHQNKETQENHVNAIKSDKYKGQVKFVRNREYKLRLKGIKEMESMSAVYRCVQIIHKIRNEQVDIVIMKLVNEHPIGEHTKHCLNKDDCKKYHIKYEDGLEVFSQRLNWIAV